MIADRHEPINVLILMTGEPSGDVLRRIHPIRFKRKNGKVYNSIEFNCNKTGLYTLWYSFKEGEQGMGVGIVSLLK